MSEADLSDVFTELSTKVVPAIVRIGRDRRGSGVVVNDGQVLTNAHNLRGSEVTVSFSDGSRRTGRVLGADLDGDLALLAVDTPAGSAVTWGGDDAGARLGQAVFSLVTVGDRGSRVTAGYVSSLDRSFRGPRGRRIRGGFEHTAPLAPGSSGGAVVDSTGQLIGINTHRLGDGFYLAVPADSDLRRRIENLSRGEAPVPVRLGIGVAGPDVARKLRASVGLPEHPGLLVREVENGSPADLSGIKRGDLLVRIGDTELVHTDDLLDALSGLAPESSVEVSLVRGAEELTVTVSFTPPPADAEASDGSDAGPAGDDTGADAGDDDAARGNAG